MTPLIELNPTRNQSPAYARLYICTQLCTEARAQVFLNTFRTFFKGREYPPPMCESQALQPAWPQSHLMVVVSLESSHIWLQYFLPSGAIQLHPS